MSERLPIDEMLKLARSGVHKIDLMGTRGATLVSTDELVAMACLLVTAGILVPRPTQEGSAT